MSEKAATAATEKNRKDLLRLVEGFEAKLLDDDLRSHVQGLIPVYKALRKLGKSLVTGSDSSAARGRILLYLRKYQKTLIAGDELMVVAGIANYARRIRELRKEYGWPVLSGKTMKTMIEADDDLDWGFDTSKLKPDIYFLAEDKQDKEAAYRWKLANDIRKSSGSMQSKLLQFLQENVGKPVTGEELAYVAKGETWARRSRELRTDEGWPVMTRNSGRPDLPVGVYILEEDRQAEKHDRNIPDPIRITVLERDDFACRKCYWSHEMANPADTTRTMLELHHIEHYAEGGPNNADNLITLCNVHHKDVHRGTISADELKEILS